MSIPRTFAALALAAAAAPAFAQDASALYLRSVAATCANCHGTDGRTVQGSAVPPIAGMPKPYMLEQLRAFREGRRPATVMHQLTKGYTEQQLDQIAGYFAAQKK